MLSSGAGGDDDDDRHLCIKCNSTILGLDNYVKHRREICGKRKYDIIKTAPKALAIDPLVEPTYSLGADVFFQSLELQSSVKKTSVSRLTAVSSAKTISNVQKSNLNVVASTSRDTPRMSPLETNLRGEDWIGGHSLRIGCNEDNQTRLINAVNNISGLNKKDSPSPSYNISYGVFNNEEFEDASDESEEDEEEDVPTTEGKWKPPPHHTGGKWRPASPDHDDWETSGGWKSIMASDSQDRDDDYDVPPPSHTKGKWVPGANEQKTQIMQNSIQNKGTVQYWCGVCNRRLGSRAVYEKHLQSNLHMKKVLPEHDLEFSGPMEQADRKPKRNTRPSQYIDNSLYSQFQRKKKSNCSEQETGSKLTRQKKRVRKSYFIHCPGCKSKVRVHLMGKHLISHYHFRKCTDNSSGAYQKLILDNMDTIVHQSPFQCSPCKFYTNWLPNFMQHWVTEGHNQKVNSIDGRYWCSFCKLECITSEEMLTHLSSSDHTEVVAAINRSMPIIIRKRTVFKCNTCSSEFRYNIEMRRHSQKTGHEMPHTATDQYQEYHHCQLCSAKFKSSLTLAAHLKSKHKQVTFYCLVCSLTFDTSIDAKRHRHTSAHRIRQKEKLIERGVSTKDLKKKCPYCIEKVVLNNIIQLKDHIEKYHPERKYKCSKCGKAFTLPQEVTKHVRENACKFEEGLDPDLLVSRVLWKCRQCPFKTTSQAECLFHEVLHSNPEVVVISKATERKIQKYKCPLCSKIFPKASLRLHIRVHTLESPLSCGTCDAKFTRPSALKQHINAAHVGNARKNTEDEHIASEAKESTGVESKFEVERCQSPEEPSAQSPLSCPHSDCHYFANTASNLLRHRKTHGEAVKRHVCQLCNFKTNQSSHLKRHLISHEGTKPYGCPHCSFTCGSLSNLRKHAARGKLHPGLPLYRCSHCSTPFPRARDYRDHLTRDHSQLYNPKQASHAAKMHLLRVQL